MKKNEIFYLRISDLDNTGRGIGRTEDGQVIFISSAVPGDEVKAKVLKVRKNYTEAEMLELVKPSDWRTEARCEHFGTCNGCKMQNLSYEAQLKIKRQHVTNAFERIGGFKNIIIPEVIGNKDIYFYRNKLEFSFSNNRWLNEKDKLQFSGFPHNLAASPEERAGKSEFALGYHMPGFIDKVLDIKKCYLQSETSNKILTITRDFFKTRKASIYSFRTHSGFLRYLVIRNSSSTGDLMINLITSYEENSLIKEYSDLIRKSVPEVTSLTNSIGTTRAQAAIGDYYKIIFGSGFIEQQIGKYKFKITPNVFFQTNSNQAKVLFDTALNFAEYEGNENVLDLYCGCGVISLYISGFVKNITGVESNDEAIDAAKENGERNSVNNCDFIKFDVKDYLQLLMTNRIDYLSSNGHRGISRKYFGVNYDIVILDPPRSGIHPKAAKYLLELKPKKIIYISCNPSTQARDIKIFAEKYDIKKVQPIDMFPHTMHTECVVKLDIRV